MHAFRNARLPSCFLLIFFIISSCSNKCWTEQKKKQFFFIDFNKFNFLCPPHCTNSPPLCNKKEILSFSFNSILILRLNSCWNGKWLWLCFAQMFWKFNLTLTEICMKLLKTMIKRRLLYLFEKICSLYCRSYDDWEIISPCVGLKKNSQFIFSIFCLKFLKSFLL